MGLLWSSLGFLSALESGLNVLYGLPNRGFLHQKLLVLGLLATALIGLLAGLTVVVASQTALSQVAPGLSHLAAWRIGGGLAISTVTTFVFLLIVYRTLPNTEVTTRAGAPGRALRDRAPAAHVRVAAALRALRRGPAGAEVVRRRSWCCSCGST